MSTASLDVRSELLTFVDGMPGFPGRQRFAVVAQPGLEPFMTLEPTEGEGPTFVVVPPSAVVDDYEVPVDNDTAEALGILDPDDAFILAIVALGAGTDGHTVNLLGPIIVNRHTGRARQVVLVDSDYPLRHPLGGAA
ncbi:flagellar assembly protein FliW [Acidothermaceae bacterium B102]|nr:flagellar assembly protein FliW [Acidothermaceae bacterium B102]